jgi:DNA-binding GntR family transcriptional regulator
MTTVASRIEEFLRAGPAHEASISAALGANRNTVRGALARLRSQGRIRKQERGVYVSAERKQPKESP